MKISHILGLNARSRLFSYPFNFKEGKRIARSKIISNKILRRAHIATPKIYKKFKRPQSVFEFDWDSLPASFVLKPSRGLGGEGIIVVKKKSKDGKRWITSDHRKISTDDLKIHTLDILEGAYSMGNVPDTAFLQEYVGRHKVFRRYAYRGTPDIRVIVFNKVPVMAMLRLPTKESGGRANLHQGAIGVGLDMSQGVSIGAIWHGKNIEYKPDSKLKLSGLHVPFWDKILTLAIECQNASGLGYLGVDIVLHPDKGPMVLELNDQPGLQIQLANMAGLRKRLDRVEDLYVPNTETGVRIAKALFANHIPTKVELNRVKKVLGSVENIKVYYGFNKSKLVKARIDSGAVRSSIDFNLATTLGLMRPENILWERHYRYRSASGVQSRPVIGITVRLGGKKIKTSASVTDRSKQTTRLLIGRADLGGFLINPEHV